MLTNRPLGLARVVLAGLLIWPLASFAPGRSEVGPPQPVGEIRAAALQDGDIIFRRGRDLMAASVLAADGAARFSHVGLILRADENEGEGALVIHAVPGEDGGAGGVIAEPLADFLAPEAAADHAIYRPRALTPGQQARLRSVALGQVGRPFDYDLRLSDPGAVYCSELVLRAFAEAGAGLDEGLREVDTVMMAEPAIAPDSLRASPLLANITARVTQPVISR
ncbi:YiiX/YebB-like N1pC/P60 family cysteine hydrolase [Erythrobacter sp. W302b]|uniref:YiiX/YebB-like N1pC/P60 family cysteine hydrolase n=1 Tax=Erythrobacter sp. W302b TaxID=3389874 RepID=UPI00396B12F6